LNRDEPDAAEIVAASLRRDGVELLCETTLDSVVKIGDGASQLQLKTTRGPKSLVADALLIAVGRSPNLEGLDLTRAGVTCDANGLVLDDRLRTTNRRIFAAGDVAGPCRFTHMAEAMSRIVIQNALFLGRARSSALTIPWCTYTDPELSHIGLSEADSLARNLDARVFVQPFAEVDRAVVEGDTEGFARVVLERRSDRILGATIVGPHAGELIASVSLAMTVGVGLKGTGKTVYPYPTRTEVLRKLADAYNRTRLTPSVRRWLERWLRWTNA
jgi:pyruvate/2-oxoglutarate dehydrogenase complex dihydrolipoamide dehydrogenase (E3) component